MVTAYQRVSLACLALTVTWVHHLVRIVARVASVNHRPSYSQRPWQESPKSKAPASQDSACSQLFLDPVL